MIFILAKTAKPELQGVSVGLRNTVNRFTGVVVPLVMGVSINWFGLENGFFVIGIFIVGILVMTATRVAGSPKSFPVEARF